MEANVIVVAGLMSMYVAVSGMRVHWIPDIKLYLDTDDKLLHYLFFSS